MVPLFFGGKRGSNPSEENIHFFIRKLQKEFSIDSKIELVTNIDPLGSGYTSLTLLGAQKTSEGDYTIYSSPDTPLIIRSDGNYTAELGYKDSQNNFVPLAGREHQQTTLYLDNFPAAREKRASQTPRDVINDNQSGKSDHAYKYTIYCYCKNDSSGEEITKEEIRYLVKHLGIKQEDYNDHLDSAGTLTIYFDSTQRLNTASGRTLILGRDQHGMTLRSELVGQLVKKTHRHSLFKVSEQGEQTYVGPEQYIRQYIRKVKKSSVKQASNTKPPSAEGKIELSPSRDFSSQSPSRMSSIAQFLQTYHQTRDNNKYKYYIGFTLFGYPGKDKLETVERLSKGMELSTRDIAILNQGSLGKQLKAKVTAEYPETKHDRVYKLLTELGYTAEKDGRYTRSQSSSDYPLQPIDTHRNHQYK